ncbi:MAG: 5-aminolevulinate synthase, partial [Proteobacteria bacterium]|nr:5-aminolevulinate synthase [Pseudomonadota bacterium]
MGKPPGKKAMTFDYDKYLTEAISSIKAEGRYRVFNDIKRNCGDFPRARHFSGEKERRVTVWCSNDYLGMAQHPKVLEAMHKALDECGAGSGGTRNIAGTNHYHVLLERELASLHGKEAGLLFTSGYISNAATLSTLAMTLPGCVVFSDALNHASMIQGIRGSKAVRHIFRHNDPKHLRILLEQTPRDVPKIIAFESVYSMDGDISPIGEICEVAKRHGALTYLDEAQHKKTVPFRIPHSLRTLLGIGPEGRILKIDGRDSVAVADGRGGSEVLSVRHRVGTRQILSELVGQTEVPIVYRSHPFADLETAYIDVTEDMLDPWLARVAFFPNVSVAAETILLKGENVLDAVMIGIHKTYYFILQVYKTMERMIFSRSVGVENISGPLGIIDMGSKVAQAGLISFIFFMAIISANLAVINFLPLPVMDGGLMVFLIIEK